LSALCLTDEYCKAVTEFDFSVQDLNEMNLSALDHAFYPDNKELKDKLSYHWE